MLDKYNAANYKPTASHIGIMGTTSANTDQIGLD